MDVPEGHDFKEYLNPGSLTELASCRLEPSLKNAQKGACFQFERMGYFCVDTDSTPEMPIFNRTVTLKDAWKRFKGHRIYDRILIITWKITRGF
jgi:glutaminyl-tRNA synthetase